MDFAALPIVGTRRGSMPMRWLYPNGLKLSLALGLITFTWTVHAGQISRESSGKSSLNGLWREISKNVGLAFTIESQPDGLLVLKNARANDPLDNVGAVIGEVRQSGKDEWIGRHTWGGTRTGDVKWGENGGLVIRRVSADRLMVRYLDSIYKDGWTYVRSR